MNHQLVNTTCTVESALNIEAKCTRNATGVSYAGTRTNYLLNRKW